VIGTAFKKWSTKRLKVYTARTEKSDLQRLGRVKSVGLGCEHRIGSMLEFGIVSWVRWHWGIRRRHSVGALNAFDCRGPLPVAIRNAVVQIFENSAFDSPPRRKKRSLLAVSIDQSSQISRMVVGFHSNKKPTKDSQIYGSPLFEYQYPTG
jgi:hypothetical protein